MGRRKTHEEFVAEVKALVGDEYKVLSNYGGSEVKVEMFHNICGHSFEMKPSIFLGGSRCLRCARNAQVSALRKTPSQFVKEVELLGNGEYEVVGQYQGSKIPVEVKHNICGNTFMTRPDTILGGHGCSICKLSKGEAQISRWLETRKFSFNREVKFNDCRDILPLRFDFGVYDENGKLITLIEYDGSLHYVSSKRRGGQERLELTQYHDKIKTEYCLSRNINLIRIPYWEFKNIDDILTQKLLPQGVG
ncbi:hypothetical protein ACQKNX_24465 [Lysinibacillus sp. NPDC093712]|uniref:hypothetical protein n=1 Tax=Lysinibacillus sp. NPDC093712 TaxID=3390579 RepID=UPI003CFCC40D